MVSGKEVGITKKPELIRQLCRKQYLLARQKQLTYNLSLSPNNFYKLDRSTPAEMICSFSRAYQQQPQKYFFHPSIESWLAESHQENTYPIENNYQTKNGILLRSKSEWLIANFIEEYNLLYKYDEALTLASKTIYPDFMIKNPFTGKLVIWEHFGALNQPNYDTNMYDKMKRYKQHGYIPFETLIYTFEFDVDGTRIKNLIEDIIF